MHETDLIDLFVSETMAFIQFPINDKEFDLEQLIQDQILYLRQTEWVFTVADLLRVYQQTEIWNTLQLPAHLKAIMSEKLHELSGVHLPEGWQKVWDEGQESHYYYNSETGESSWEFPDIEDNNNAFNDGNETEDGYITPYESRPPAPVNLSSSWKPIKLSSSFQGDVVYRKEDNQIYLKGTVKRINAGENLCMDFPHDLRPRAEVRFRVAVSANDNTSQSVLRLCPSGPVIRVLDTLPTGSWINLSSLSWDCSPPAPSLDELDETIMDGWETLPLAENFKQPSDDLLQAQYRLHGDICELRGRVRVNVSGKECEAWTAFTLPLPEKCCPPKSFVGEAICLEEDNTALSGNTQTIKLTIYSATRQIQLRQTVRDGNIISLDGIKWSCSDEGWKPIILPDGFVPPMDPTEQIPEYRIDANNLVRLRGVAYASQTIDASIPSSWKKQKKPKGLIEDWLPCENTYFVVDCAMREKQQRNLIVGFGPKSPHIFLGTKLNPRDSFVLDSIRYFNAQ